MISPDYVEQSKVKAQLANAITLMNLSFGVVAIILIIKGLGHMSLLFIFLAALFDRFDGMVARHYNAESLFGKELDSLCDLVSFGSSTCIIDLRNNTSYDTLAWNHRYHFLCIGWRSSSCPLQCI